MAANMTASAAVDEVPTSMDDLTRRNIEAITKLERAAEVGRTHGERVADGVAGLVGSWPFIITQSVLLFGWIVLNVIAFMKHWDPYPFILLNLALSFQAAYTGPIVMMSQNRQSQLAERRNRLDLQINLLSEQENTEILRLLRLVCAKHEIDVGAASNVELLQQETQPAIMFDQIEQASIDAAAGKHDPPQESEDTIE